MKFKNSRGQKTKYKDTKAAFLFLLPSLAGVCIFFVFPFIDTVRRSFFDVIGKNFSGMGNYKSVIGNQSFRSAAQNTLRFIGICIPILVVLSLCLALLMRVISPGGRRFKTIYLLPMSIPVASMVLLWKMLFDDKGIINGWLLDNGKEAVSFMNSNAAFWVLVGTYVWKNVGYDMVLWLAELDGISSSLYEAARVDGAGAFACFRYITMPSLAPALGMVTVISLLNSFKVFREAYLVAGSYPHDSMYLLQHLFNNWFRDMDISRLCAAAVLLCLGLLVIILIVEKFLRAED